VTARPLRTEAGRRAGRLLALCLAGAGLPALAATDGLPTTDTELVATVRTAIADRDLATFERLINWDGASVMRRRMVTFEVRHGLGRPIRSITLEPFAADGLATVEARGTLKANMPVTNQLRVVFDEPPTEGLEKPPTAVFLIGRQDDAYRIALVVRNGPPRRD
jgi:hypothetical protein